MQWFVYRLWLNSQSAMHMCTWMTRKTLEVMLIEVFVSHSASPHSWNWILQAEQSLYPFLFKNDPLFNRYTIQLQRTKAKGLPNLLVGNNWLHSKEWCHTDARFQRAIDWTGLWTHYNPSQLYINKIAHYPNCILVV